MALVTLQRSPTPSAASSGSTEDFGSDDDRKNNQCLSESFFMVKGAALFLQQGGIAQEPNTQHTHTGDLPRHLQVMFKILRAEDRIKLTVRLESGWSERVRYLVVIYTSGHQDTEENIVLGLDFADKESKSCSVGMVLPLWSDTNIHLDGDGGFSVSTAGHSHVFKPVSVQAMWTALQVIHKACEVSRRCNYFPGGGALCWTSFYDSSLSSEQSGVNEWNAMTDLQSTQPDSPGTFVDRPTERERTESSIKAKLRNIMMFQDLENITSKEIRNVLEQHMSCNLKDYKEFIDNEMLLILGQMDKATPIFDHVYLGSEWNASNLEELRDCGVGYILNVTREIDNFFPGLFLYHNVRVYDEEATDLLSHWNDTYNFITKAKKNSSKCLVHCKMGVSRSASTVIAYAMKEFGWSLEKSHNFVKQKRSVAQPNAAFMKQLQEYQGILDASKQRHNKLWRPETDEESSDDLQASGHTTGGEETPGLTDQDTPGMRDEETPEAWGGCGASPCRMGLEMEPLDSLNYNYYFRRLSDSALDSALDSEPSTPVRGPPLLGMERVFIEIEDVERDALLEDDRFPMVHLPSPGEGTAAQTCGRMDPMEDMRLRLEFSTLEEEDEEEEEEAQKQEAMAQASEGSEGKGEDEEQSRLGLANLNTNNSNRLAAKRSCPAAFDDSGSSSNPLKVKPSYQSCKDCLRLPQGRRCDRTAGGRRLNPSRHLHPPGHLHPSGHLHPPGHLHPSGHLHPPGHTYPPGHLPSIHIHPPGTVFPSGGQSCSTGVPLSQRLRLSSPMSCEESGSPPEKVQGHSGAPCDVAPPSGPSTHCDKPLQLRIPVASVGFGLELMQQEAQQLEKAPSLAPEAQVPVLPLP